MSNTMTDQEVKELTEALSDVRSEDNEMIENLPSNNGVEERVPDDPYEYEEEEVTSYTDPMTGESKIIPEKIDPLNDITIDESGLDGLLNMSDEDIKTMDITLDEFKQALSELPSLNNEDTKALKKVFDRYRFGEEFSLYNSFPNNIKKYVDATVSMLASDNGGTLDTKDMRSVISKTILDDILNNIHMNKVYTDLNSSVNDAFKEIKDTTTSETNLNVRTKISAFKDLADKIKEENPEKSEALYRFYDAFIEAQEYNKLREAVCTGRLRAKKIEIEKFERTCSGFLRTYMKSSKILDDPTQLYPIIHRHIGCSIDDAKRIIIAFIKYTEYNKMDLNVLEDYCFIYYFIKNILGLDNHSRTMLEETTFYAKIKNNLKALLDDIKSVEDNIVNKNKK